MKLQRHNSGFTLIEVLIAVFVLAIGILGIAGLQLFASQNSYDAIQRTTAASLADGIVQRMRVNSDNLNLYVSSVTPIPQNTAAPGANECSDPNNDCTEAQLAAYDLKRWYRSIVGATEVNADTSFSGGLVAPSACITELADGEYRVAIAWRGRTALSNPTASNCGEAAAGNIYGANNEYRRLFFIDASFE